jgi:hypothetical protein
VAFFSSSLRIASTRRGDSLYLLINSVVLNLDLMSRIKSFALIVRFPVMAFSPVGRPKLVVFRNTRKTSRREPV